MTFSMGEFRPDITATWSTRYLPDVTMSPHFIDLDAEMIPPLPNVPINDYMMTRQELEEIFETKIPEDIKILVACINSESYEEQAFILFDLWGVLFEVNAYHCSCYGFEETWKPELALTAELRNRVFRNVSDKDDHRLKAVVNAALDAWEKAHNE